MIQRSALVLALLLLPALASAKTPGPPYAPEALVNHWAGAMMMTHSGVDVVLPVEFTFKADGTVTLLNRGGSGRDEQVQKYTFDKTAKKITLIAAKKGKSDVVLQLTTLNAKTLIGVITPPDGRGPTIKLLFGKVAK